MALDYSRAQLFLQSACNTMGMDSAELWAVRGTFCNLLFFRYFHLNYFLKNPVKPATYFRTHVTVGTHGQGVRRRDPCL